MTTQNDPRLQAPEEQVVYANILTLGVWICLGLMILFYSLYVFGIIAPHVDFETMTTNWGKGVAEYLHITQSPHGLGWLFLLHKGDFLNYIGFGLLALLTIFCFIPLLIGCIKKKDWLYAAICLAEIIVLSLAASGIFGSGGH